jgi:hypothetical protein
MDRRRRPDENDPDMPAIEKQPAEPIVSDSNTLPDNDANGDDDDEREGENEADGGGS